MGGRSGRGAWGGGFGEGGKRGSSDELLPSRTAPQRSTSSSYFYFLRVLLTFKMPAPLLCTRAPRPSPFVLGQKSFQKYQPIQTFGPVAPASGLTSSPSITSGCDCSVSPEGGEGSSPGSRPSSGALPLPFSPQATRADVFFYPELEELLGIPEITTLPHASVSSLQIRNEKVGCCVVRAALATKG